MIDPQAEHDRILDSNGAILLDGLTEDEARAQHARLVSEGTPHRWQRYGGQRAGFSSVARFDALDDIHDDHAVTA